MTSEHIYPVLFSNNEHNTSSHNFLYFSKTQNAVLLIVCEGNEFQGALDKVWKLNEVLMKEPAKVHQNAVNYDIEIVNKNTTIQGWQTAIDNQMIKNKMQFTAIPPLGSCN